MDRLCCRSILFYIFATILVAAAVGVIVSRNPVYSALLLVLCFVTSAAIWLLLQAEFLALVLVLVYVGAVMVLFLFVVMMLDIDLEALRAGFTRYAWLGGSSPGWWYWRSSVWCCPRGSASR